MKLRSLNIWGSMAIAILSLSSCKKEADSIFTMFDDVTVTFHGDNPLSVTDYKEVNVGDSVYIDYTITSASKDMYQINVLEVGSNTPFVREAITDPAKRRSYSGVVKLKASQKVGEISYRVWAVDKDGIYIGDGYKKVIVNVKPDFSLTGNRVIYLPDSVEKVRPSYYSIARAEAFSYTNGKENSKDIDFGIYRTLNASSGLYSYSLYSLKANPLPFTVYDISTWDKRATLFSTASTGGANLFNRTLLTGEIIEVEAKKRKTDRTTIPALVPGSLFYFLTPEGKHGVVLVNQITTDFNDRPLMNISLKIQK